MQCFQNINNELKLILNMFETADIANDIEINQIKSNITTIADEFIVSYKQKETDPHKIILLVLIII